MGCVDSTRIEAPSEVPLIAFEKSLGFDKWPTATVTAVIKKYSFSRCVNFSQLEAICDALDLPLVSEEETYDKLIGGLCEGDSIEVSRLLTLGILCSEGSVTEKANELFETHDPELTGQLDAEGLAKVLDCLLNIVLTTLTCNHPSPYTSKCKSALPLVKRYLTNCLSQGKDTCSKPQFIDCWEKLRGGQLLTPSALRQYMYTASTPRLSPFEYISKPLYANLAA